MNYLHDFKSGAACALHGVTEFYSRPGYWIYMVIPLIMILAVYCIAAWAAWEVYAWLTGLLPDMQELNAAWRWLAAALKWITGATIFIATAVMMGICANSLFEGFGAFIFDSMVAEFEFERYGHHAEKVNFIGQVKIGWAAVKFAVVTLILGFMAWLIGLFIPFFGWLLPTVVTCRRIGCSYLWSSMLTHNALAREKEIFAVRRGVVAGFGLVCTIMLSIPVVAVLIIPGITLGGAIVYNEYLALTGEEKC